MARITLPLVLAFSLLVNSFTVEAQRWQRFRHEVSFGLGGSNYLGDLGGRSVGDGSRFGDFQLSVTRPSMLVSYRYRVLERVSVKGNFIFGQVSGTDEVAGGGKNTTGRLDRNLNFRSPVIEASVQGEFYFIGEKDGSAYRIRGMRGSNYGGLSAYLFGGIGAFYFDPRGQDDAGNWVRLKPLKTEGQGLPGGPDEYSSIAIAVPMGFGVRWALNRQFTIGFEYGLRLTNTDYLDDVSGKYYEPSALQQANGPKAKELADKRLSGRYKNEGSSNLLSGIRGNPKNNDVYMFGFVTLSYKLRKGSISRARF